MGRLKPKESAQDAERRQSLERLRSKKSQVGDAIDEVKGSTRFEADGTSDTSTLDEAMSGKVAQTPASRPTGTPGMAEKEQDGGYTSRLLAAKKAAKKKSDGQ